MITVLTIESSQFRVARPTLTTASAGLALKDDRQVNDLSFFEAWEQPSPFTFYFHFHFVVYLLLFISPEHLHLDI